MTDLLRQRAERQLLNRPRFKTPAEVVRWFGAIQAQDYLGALWALGVRIPGATDSMIESTLAEGSVIRTHVFRGTWQYVAREDLRWMLALVGARVIAAAAGRYRELELDSRTLGRCRELLARALEGGHQFTRAEMGEVLRRGRIGAVNRRLLHILGHAELAGVICSGGRRGKQLTFALFDERIPPAAPLPREAALAELAQRYFQSRGPATERDFAWWTGLTLTESRQAIEYASGALHREVVSGQFFWHGGKSPRAVRSPEAHLLPPFDEYLVAYQDRTAMLDPAHLRKVNAGGGILKPAVIVAGNVVGTWRRTLEKQRVTVTIRLFQSMPRVHQRALEHGARRYADFLRLPHHFSIKGLR